MNDGMIEQPGSALSPPGQNPQDPFSPHSTTPLNYPSLITPCPITFSQAVPSRPRTPLGVALPGRRGQ